MARLFTPSSASAPAKIGAHKRSPRLEMASSERGVSSRSNAVPSKSRWPSAKISSNVPVTPVRRPSSGTSAASAAACCRRNSAISSDPASRSPLPARSAASTNRLVTPLIAETTATTAFSRAACATICAARAMHDASPTDVPPNFITCTCDFICDRHPPSRIPSIMERMKIVCRGVLFDLDGVLVDSTPAVARVWAKWAAKHGFVAEEVVRQAHGRPSITTIRELLPHADHDAENREVERGPTEDVEGVIPLPGALELLQALPQDRWAIATSCSRPLAEVRIRTAGLPFPKHLITSTDVQRGKPDPEPYIKAAKILGLTPADCIVIEDAPAGIRAGKAAAARVFALRTPAPASELIESGADWIANNLASLRLASTNGDGSINLLFTER